MENTIFGWMATAGLAAGLVLSGCSSNNDASGGGGGGSGGGGGGFGGFGAAGGQAGAAGAGATAGAAGSTNPPGGSVGAACTQDSDCGSEPNAGCLKDAEGWPNGYCTVSDCSAGNCPSGSECFQTASSNTLCLLTCTAKSECPSGYACHSAGACIPACASEADCDAGEICDTQSGLCKDKPCTQGSCPGGLTCDSASGKCIPDAANGPGPGPGPDCTAVLPERDCQGTAAYCGELSSFEPKTGTGYEDYPINGETATNQYRSYARRDLQMLVQWAAAYVDCKAKSWTNGNGGPIGFGDMSEKDGAIPGTSVGSPGHPAGTHVNGYDMDVGYFQVGTVDNHLRPICEHTQNGQDQYHCVAPPDKLDLWRTTLYLGALFTSQTVRVIGVDGQVGPLVEQAMPALCATGWLPQYSCDALAGKFGSQKQYGLAFETTNTGAGWFQFHHHHMHISLNGKVPSNPTAIAPDFGLSGSALAPESSVLSISSLLGVPGHAVVDEGIVRRLGRNLPGLR